MGDLGLFGPDSVTWRLHREPILLLGGLRALYLQSLNPRAVTAVEQHSNYREDPWGRLERTAIYVATVVYGTTEQAERAGRRVRAVHARLRGTDRITGESYRLDDPDLLRWVHVTEVESFLDCARRAGTPLSAEDADRYYDEQRRGAALVGLDPATVPGSVAEVAAYYETVRPGLSLTADAASSALFLTVPRLPWGLGFTPVRGMYLGTAALAIGMLPAWARRLYGLPGLATTGRVASLGALGIRTALRVLPDRLVHGPIYKDAMRRASALAAGRSAGD